MVNATTPSSRRGTSNQRRHGLNNPLSLFSASQRATGDGSSSQSLTSNAYGIRDTSLDGSPSTRSLQSEISQALASRATAREARHREEWTVTELLNTESRTRLMVSRLHDLINQLCSLRIRAVGLNESLSSSSHHPLRTTLNGLDDSLCLLDSAIKDLEERVSIASRSLGRAAGQRISDWSPASAANNTIQIGTPPLARWYARTTASDTPHINAPETRLLSYDTLQQRLAQFSENLAGLNLRLDHVASNFNGLYGPRVANSQASTDEHQEIDTSHIHGDQTQNNPIMTRFPGPFIASADTNFLPDSASDLSPEERELALRIRRLREDNIGSVSPWSAARSSEGLLTLGRRELNIAARQQPAHQRSIPSVDESGAHSIAEMSNEPSRETFKQELVATILDGAKAEVNEGLLIRPGEEDRNEASSPKPTKISSHAPLYKEQERIFIDGIEYRNCLGLWLSSDWTQAPAHAIANACFTKADCMDTSE